MTGRLRGLALLILPLAAAGCGPKPAPDPILVGHVVSLSGPDRATGEHAQHGIQLALDDPEDKRRIAGRKVMVLHVDDRSEDDLVRAETVRLLTVNKVAALIGDSRASTAERLAHEAQAYGVPALLPTEILGPTRGDMIFSLAVDPAQRGRLLARHLSQKPQTRVLVFTDEHDPVAVALAQAFVQVARRNKAPLVEERALGGDLEADRQALAKQKPDAILLACSPRRFAAQRERLAFPGVVAYGGEDASAHSFRGAGPVLLATVFARGGLTEGGKEFVDRYEKHFHEPPDLAAAQAYDSARLLLDALKETQSSAGPALRDHLNKQTNFVSVTGPLSFKDRLPQRKIFIVTVAATGAENLLESHDSEGGE